jgi:hypothetical protein
VERQDNYCGKTVEHMLPIITTLAHSDSSIWDSVLFTFGKRWSWTQTRWKQPYDSVIYFSVHFLVLGPGPIL